MQAPTITNVYLMHPHALKMALCRREDAGLATDSLVARSPRAFGSCSRNSLQTTELDSFVLHPLKKEFFCA